MSETTIEQETITEKLPSLQEKIINRLKDPTYIPFELSKKFVKKYSKIKPPFGFNGLGELVYRRTYSRLKTDGTNEQWFETVERVVNGTYNMQKRWVLDRALCWDEHKAQESAQEMYDRMFHMKFLPPGRGLWAMGSSITEERGLYTALNNCAFISTNNIAEEFSKPFVFLMDMSMLGVGVGFDTKGANKLIIKGPKKNRQTEIYEIPDTREGWVTSVEILIDSYLKSTAEVIFSYDKIRKEGEPIKGFGGISSGPKPLMDLHDVLRKILNREVGKPISITTIVDIMNLIGKCVVSGNVRRTAEIVFGDPENEEYLDLKNYGVNPHRLEYGWTSNNSVFAKLGMNYEACAERTSINGEPGYAWLDNMRSYGRMIESANNKDYRVCGGNPCLEQSLESYELCCVSGDTRILTKTGYPRISSVVGTKVEVWNGFEFSRVIPFIAKKNQDLYRVYLSDGSYLDVTSDHKWSIRKYKDQYIQLETKDLIAGQQLESFNVSLPFKGKKFKHSFELGMFLGDGYIDGNKIKIELYGNKIKLDCNGSRKKIVQKEGYNVTSQEVDFTGLFSLDLAKRIKNNSGLPEEVFSMDKESILNFVAGWIETDGNVCKQKNTDNYRVFGSENNIRDLQLILRKIGINNSAVYLMSKKGDKTNYGIRNYDIWVCLIPSYECRVIPTQIKKVNRIGSKYKNNNAHKKSKLIDASRKQKIVKIEKLNDKHTVYCFNEPIRHMGVFGNCLTYQCLVENFPNRHTDLNDFLRTLKFSYLYAKTVTLAETHWVETNRVMLRNRRIGCSVSGIAQFLSERSIGELKEWMELGYEKIQYYDTIYSDWLCIPKSIKTTSVKPSGSVSLLAGATPGVHFPISEYYIRRVRIGKTSELVKPLLKAGYTIEQAAEDETTLVVEIPVHSGKNIRSDKEVSMWEKLCLAAFMQGYWADNQVSSTVTFNPKTEGKDIAFALNFFQYWLKGISFLPMAENVYKQMPYESITKEEFEKRVQNLKKPDFSKTMNENEEQDKFCDGETCKL